MTNIIRVVVCRAAGLMDWVVEVHYNDGRRLLDLGLQHRTWQGCVALAYHTYRGKPVTVEADKFWTRKRKAA